MYEESCARALPLLRAALSGFLIKLGKHMNGDIMTDLLNTSYNKHRWQRRCAVLPVVFALVLASSALFGVSAGVFPDRGWSPASPESQGINAEKLKEAMDYIEANAGGPGAAESLVRTQSGTGRFSFPEAKPEHVGMNEAKLREARAYALRGGGSGCIFRGGRLVMTWGDQQCRSDIFSSTKSIGVTALGLADSPCTAPN